MVAFTRHALNLVADHAGNVLFIAYTVGVLASIGLCLWLAFAHGAWGALAILALPAVWLLMWWTG